MCPPTKGDLPYRESQPVSLQVATARAEGVNEGNASPGDPWFTGTGDRQAAGTLAAQVGVDQFWSQMGVKSAWKTPGMWPLAQRPGSLVQMDGGGR